MAKRPLAGGRGATKDVFGRPSRVPLAGATTLATIGQEEPFWESWSGEGGAALKFDTGTLLRLRPPEGFEDAEAVREAALRGGAAAVVVEAAPRGKVVPERPAEESGAHRRPREVAMGMVEEARTSDRDALRECVGELLSRAGL